MDYSFTRIVDFITHSDNLRVIAHKKMKAYVYNVFERSPKCDAYQYKVMCGFLDAFDLQRDSENYKPVCTAYKDGFLRVHD